MEAVEAEAALAVALAEAVDLEEDAVAALVDPAPVDLEVALTDLIIAVRASVMAIITVRVSLASVHATIMAEAVDALAALWVR